MSQPATKPAAKQGRRHSATDQRMLNSIFAKVQELQQLAVELGAQVADIADVTPQSNQSDAVEMNAVHQVEEATEVEATETPAMEAAETYLDGITINDPNKPATEIKPVVPAASAANDGGKSASLDLSYVKRLGVLPETQLPELLAVKKLGQDTIKGYVVLWGDPAKTDLEQEYFTKSTDFWDKSLGLPRTLTWDHALDDTMKANPVIGEITEMGDDEIGRWYVAQLDRNHKYRKAIDQLIEKKAVGTSSDSAPQYVVKEKTGKAVWLKQWPLFAAALTTTPCEPRMLTEGSLVWKTVKQQLQGPDGQRLDNRQLEAMRRQVEVLKLSFEE